MDYSDKYGLGYQLCDNRVGVAFNDNSKAILDAAGRFISFLLNVTLFLCLNFSLVCKISNLFYFSWMKYTEPNNVTHFYAIDNHPSALDKKITILNRLRKAMNEEHLMKTGINIPNREGVGVSTSEELARLPCPCLKTWFRTESAIVLHLSNGTLQINFVRV